ncbi:MAG: hypothetical protein ACLPKB_16685 [Xanthobacteraceae bacterium]
MSNERIASVHAGFETDDATTWMIAKMEYEAAVPIAMGCEAPIERNTLVPRRRVSGNDQDSGDNFGMIEGDPSGRGRAR